MIKRFSGLLSIVVLLSFGLVACGSDAATSAPAATTTQAATSATTAPSTSGSTAPASTSATTAPASSDAGSTAPAYPGGKKITLPTDTASQLASITSSVKGSKTDVYATADAADKAQKTISDAFKQSGWEDKSKDLGFDAANAAANSAGVYYIGFLSGDKIAVVVVFGGSAATTFASDVPSGGSAVVITSGTR